MLSFANMSKQRTFIVIGKEPAHSKEANMLLKAFDLGIEGAFVPFVYKVCATLSDDVTPEQYERQPDGFKAAYEQAGCIDVYVVELGNE